MEFEAGVVLPDLSGFTMLLPSVSVGNVGQLAIDVVLATLKPTLITQVRIICQGSFLRPNCLKSIQILHPSLIPCAGADPLNVGSPILTTAMQLYIHPESKLVVFQIRSGLLPGKGGAFLTDLLEWAKEVKITKLVCLSSSHAHERSDVQLRGSPLRFLASSTLDKEASVPEGFIRLESKERFPGICSQEQPEAMFIPGGGLAKRFLQGCEEKEMQGLVLLKFCAEGDNTQDAIQVKQVLGGLQLCTKVLGGLQLCLDGLQLCA